MVESDALVNGVLSFVIPGLGQAIEGYKTRGIIMFIIALIIAGALIYFHAPQIVQYAISAIFGPIAA